ncbi:hypothetical protein GCM10027059_38780 [Myceligenerans halotolerans]
MRTVGTRELKQNPQAVIQRVLETGEDHEITAYGQPTGVVLVRREPRPKRWVRGSEMPEITPMSREDREAWKRDIDVWEKEELVDPWERR